MKMCKLDSLSFEVLSNRGYMIFLDFVMHTLPLNCTLKTAWIHLHHFFYKLIVSVGNRNPTLLFTSLHHFDITPQVARCCSVAKFNFLSDRNLVYCSIHDKEKLLRLKYYFSNIHFFQNCRQCNDAFHWGMSQISFTDNMFIWFFLSIGVCFWKKRFLNNESVSTKSSMQRQSKLPKGHFLHYSKKLHINSLNIITNQN